jgi:hypothetical protein
VPFSSIASVKVLAGNEAYFWTPVNSGRMQKMQMV